MKNIFIALGVSFLLPIVGIFAFGGKGSCRVGVECVQPEVVERIISNTIISDRCGKMSYMTRSRSVRNWRVRCERRNRAGQRRTQMRRSRILQAGLPRLRATRRIRVFSERTRKKSLQVRRSTRSQYSRYGKCSPFQKGC